ATGVEMARKMGAADATIFFPVDHPLIVRRALQAFDPMLVIFLETEIWPNYLWVAHRRGIPVLLLSGRISARSLRRYRWFSWLFGRAVRCFSALGVQTESDAQRMAALGADRSRIAITGSLKYDIDRTGSVNGNGKLEGYFLPEGPSPRSLWVAGSTHDGEETIILDAYRVLKSRFPGLLLVLAPRHPHRFGEVEKLLQKRRVRYVKKSDVADRMPPSDVLLLDSMGELSSFYALADATFVGGSLVNAGGHNILEPARLRKPVFFGPYMGNFAEAAAEMEQKGGGVTVRTKEELARELEKVLADSQLAETMGDSAHCVVARHGGVLAQSMQLVSRYLG
ncbi:MAG: 3-deoxy-D-manno-octulosonic acid transferase, partial [Candidatus Binatia bacterium]